MADLSSSTDILVEDNNGFVEEMVEVDLEVPVSDEVPVEGDQLGYKVEDSDVIKELRDQPESAAVEIIVIIVIFALVIAGVIFFFVSRRKGQAVPTSEPEDGDNEEDQQALNSEKYDGAVVQEQNA